METYCIGRKTASSFQDLQKVYEEGLLKGDKRTRVNLVTHFASIAEGNAQKSEANCVMGICKTIISAKWCYLSSRN